MLAQPIRYYIDTYGIIVDIDGHWDDCAIENGSYMLRKENVLRKNIFDAICGDRLKHIYRSLHEILFETVGKSLIFDYRNDSPFERRDMRMSMRSENGLIVYESRLNSSTHYESSLPVNGCMIPGKTELAMCSFCKSFTVTTDETQWSAIETIFDHVSESFSLVHSICPSCSRMLTEKAIQFKLPNQAMHSELTLQNAQP